MGRKRPLKESLDENTCPSAKRVRLEPEDHFLIPTRSTRNHGRRLRRRNDEEELRQGPYKSNTGGKRSSANVESFMDENDITELTRQFKRARLRPFLFSISSFIEQTVGDIQITVGEEEDENQDGEASTTFTFRLPSPRLHEPNSSFNATQESSPGDEDEA